MRNWEETLAAQYSNSPTILALIKDFNDCIDPSANIAAFYDLVWNVDTAQGFGLDIWGRIVGVTRNIKVAASAAQFGFREGVDYQPFGQAPFNSGVAASSTYTLSDDAFRTLILVKALANISNSTSRSYNRLLQNLFAGRGRSYVQDTGQMQMRYVFEFDLLPYELSIMTASGAFPTPAAVDARVMTIDPSTTFGFREAGVLQPFGQGNFFPTSGLQNVV